MMVKIFSDVVCPHLALLNSYTFTAYVVLNELMGLDKTQTGQG